jgi:protease-4
VQAVKPVVASFSDTAASGGYYVAAASDVILAEANTITGSIGVFSVKPDLSKLYDLVGIRPHVQKTSEHSDWNLTTRGLTEEERATIRHVLESYYDAFIERVALGRQMEERRVRELAQGRVYTGQKAMMLGLVDGLGGLADAVAEIRTRAGLEPGDELAVDIPQRSWSLDDMVAVLSNAGGSVLETWQDLQRRVLALDGKALALIPVSVEVGR